MFPETHAEILTKLIELDDLTNPDDYHRSVRRMMLTLMREASDLALEISYFGAAAEMVRRGIITNVEVTRAPATPALWPPRRLVLFVLRPLRRLLSMRRAAAARPREHTGRSGSPPAGDSDRTRWQEFARHVKLQ